MSHRIQRDDEHDLSVDDLMAKGAYVHLERMADNFLSLNVTADDGTQYLVHIIGGGKINTFAHITEPTFCPPNSTSMRGTPGCSTCFEQQIKHRANTGELAGIDILRAQMNHGMFTCSNCGNKRCPKASNHRNVCQEAAA